MLELTLMLHVMVTSLSIASLDMKGVSLLHNAAWVNNEMVVCWEAYDTPRKYSDYYYKGCYTTYKLKVPFKRYGI